MLDIVFNVFNWPLPGEPCQLHTTRLSCICLHPPLSMVHLSYLECNGHDAKNDCDQRVQVQAPGVVWALDEDDRPIGSGKGEGIVI